MNDRKLKYATICSGIECCSVALRGMNWEPVFFSEIDRNPSLILRHRWPTVPNLGDIQKIHYDRQTHTITNGSTSIDFDGQLDVLAGGTPCTDVSLIGQRKGMSEGSGTDSALAFEYVRLVREFRPKWIVWENVDGVFSSHGGKDFGSFVEALAACGYVLSWRVLSPDEVSTDVHPNGIPQHRRRVWLVGHIGDEPGIVEQVLFDAEGDPGSYPTGGTPEKEDSAGTPGNHGKPLEVHGRPVVLALEYMTTRATARAMCSDHESYVANDTNLLVQSFVDLYDCRLSGQTSPTLSTKIRLPDSSGPKVVQSFVDLYNQTLTGETSPAVTSATGTPNTSGPKVAQSFVRLHPYPTMLDGASTITTETGEPGSASPNVYQFPILRRITPFEAERLMGLPDGYTLVPGDRWRRTSEEDKAHILAHCPEYADAKFWRTRNGKLQTRLLADGPRYKACGNGWATNCARWILQRIDEIERQ